MTVGFKSPVSSPNVNNAFASKTSDNTMTGQQTLNRTGSGNQVTDVQQTINDLIAEDVNLQTQITTNTNNIATNASNISSNDTDIANLQNRAVTASEGVQRDSGTNLLSDANFRLDVDGLTEDAGIEDTDFLVYYDVSAGIHKKIQSTEVGGTNFIGKKETPVGVVDGVNTTFDITLLPIEATILVLRNGTVVPESEYSFTNPTITFTTAPAAGSIIEAYYLTDGTSSVTPGNSGVPFVEYFDIDATDLTNGFVTLANTPAEPTKVILDAIGGTAQRYNIDFQITSGNRVDWNSLRLETQIGLGAELRVFYFA